LTNADWRRCNIVSKKNRSGVAATSMILAHAPSVMLGIGNLGELAVTSGIAAVKTVGSVSDLALTSGALAASVLAVSKLVSCVGVGYWAAQAGVLDPPACATLSKLIYSVFQPALLLVNVASTLASPAESLKTLLLIPAFALVHIGIGAIMGSVMVRALRLNSNTVDGRELKMACSFSNAGPLPLLFVDALFRTSSDPTLAPRAVAFISFYLLGWSPAFWTIGRNMLAPPTTSNGSDGGVDSGSWTERIFGPPVVACLMGAIIGGLPLLSTCFLGNSAPLKPITDSLSLLGQAYVPAVILTLAGTLHQVLNAKPRTPNDDEMPLDLPAASSLFSTGKPKSQRVSRLNEINEEAAGNTIVVNTKSVTTREQNTAGGTRADGGVGAPKRSGATTTLWRPRKPNYDTASPLFSSRKPKKQHVSLGTKVGALSLARFVAMPIIGLLLLAVGTNWGIIPSNDPLLRFVLLMQACMPSTQNSLVILQLDKNVEGAGSMAKTISALYIAAIIPMSILLSSSRMVSGLI